MARQRCTPPLFIVCSLLILATVITAFRLRDLTPRSSAERQVSSRRNPLLEKCESCESVSDHRKQHSVSALKVKEIASRRSYEDVKNAVKVKQQTLNEKKIQQKDHQARSFLHEDSDEDDDDDVTISKVKIDTKTHERSASATVKVEKPYLPSKIENSIKKTISPLIQFSSPGSENDDDDDSDEDDDDDTEEDDDEDSNNEDDNDDDDDDVNNSDDDDDSDDGNNDDEDSDEDGTDHDDKIKRQGEKQIKLPAIKEEQISKPIVKLNVQHPVIKKTPSVQKVTQKDNDDDDDSDDDDTASEDDENMKQKIKTMNTKHSNEAKIDTHKRVSEVVTKDKSELLKNQINNQNQQPEKKKHISSEESLATSHGKAYKPPEKSLGKPVKEIMPPPKDKKSSEKEDAKKEAKPHQDREEKKDHKTTQHEVKRDHKENDSKTIKVIPKEEKTKKVSDREGVKEQSIREKPEPIQTKEESKKSAKKEHLEKKHTEPNQHKGKEQSFMKQASDALYRKNFLESEFEDFYAFLPSFAPNFSRIHNPECRRHGQILMRQLRGSKQWALNMLDASAKVPSGILQGNGNQLGDFDQCLSSRARVRLDSGHVVRVRGRYCLAQLDLRAAQDHLRLPVHLAQARTLLKSKVDDPGHFIPRFSTLNWGVCLPSACGAEDAEFVLRDALRHYQLTGLQLRVHVDPLNCHVEDDEPWDEWLEPPTLAAISLFSGILLLVLYATLKDFLARRSSDKVEGEEPQEQTDEDLKSGEEDSADKGSAEETNDQQRHADEGAVAAFSLYRSAARLARGGDAEELACVHGVRALCSLALLLAHKIIPVADTPFLNRVQLTELSHTPLSYPLRVGWVYTDAFLLLSGALTAHRLSADLDGDAVPWLRRYVARYVRLTPALLAVVLFYAYVWDELGAGPLWGTLVSHNARLCQESWWWNLLYVQNFFSFDQMCAPQTYQLALDMQLTLFAAALVWLLRARPWPAAGILVALQAVAAYARYAATAEHRLSLLIYHGASVSQLYRTARLSYTSPLHRSTPYLAGLALGVLLQRQPTRSISKLVLAPCWVLCLLCAAGSMHAVLEAASPDARYDAAAAAAYAALAPPAAAAALAWLIYAAQSGNAQWMSRVLCARPLVLVSRLSYALYLVQFLVFFSGAATVRGATEFTLLSIFDVREMVALTAASVVLTLTLVIPMQSLSKYVMSYELGSKEPSDEEPQERSAETAPEDAPGIEDEPDNPEEEIEEVVNVIGQRITAHREILEEILEAEVEYESQRDSRDDGLEEIMEEEEDELLEEEEDLEVVEGEEVEDLEVVEGEVQGGEDFWGEREEPPRRASRYFDRDEWEWTGSDPDAGARSHRYGR